MFKKINILFFILSCLTIESQILNTDIWLFKLKRNKNELLLVNPINITNRPGYDNQPSFSNDSKKIFFVSVKNDNQSDIYCYHISKKTTLQLTNTTESEYSPYLNQNSNYLNSVVVEKDSSQRIHFINSLNGLSEKKIDIDSVGYYTFLNSDTVLHYKLTSPHSLRCYVISSNKDFWLANNPIRAFKTINRYSFIYGIKDSLKVTYYNYDFRLQKAEKYAQYNSLNEDFIWHQQFGLIKSEGNKLWRFDEKNQNWILFYDLSSFGIKKISRFTFDPKNKFLVVVDNI